MHDNILKVGLNVRMRNYSDCQSLVSVINECTVLDVRFCKDVAIFKTALHLLYIVKLRSQNWGVCVWNVKSFLKKCNFVTSR